MAGFTLKKSNINKTLTGTLGGISEYLDFDYTWSRIIFCLVLLLTKGLAAFLYLLLVLIIPKEKLSMVRVSKREILKINFMYYLKKFWQDLKWIGQESTYRKLFGLVLLFFAFLTYSKPFNVVSGTLLLIGTILLTNIFFRPQRNWSKTYPVDLKQIRPN